MDQIFNRLSNLVKSFFADDEESLKTKYRSTLDPDEQDAWDELNDFLNDDNEEPRQKQYQEYKEHSYTKAQHSEKDALRQDYKTLECDFGASFDEVKKSYKRLLRQYHPDKYANQPDKLKFATEITTKLNQAFQKIEKFEEKNNKK
ncbi:MAG: DnaJ domain-containing protein [Spirochaetales bacterium]|nr:DnaJ domain-containing protein [Spirochaetales bacterium]